MRWVFLLISYTCALSAANLNWSEPYTLLTPSDHDGRKPKIWVHPTLPNASAVWIAAGTETIIQSSTYNGTTWSSPETIESTPNALSSLSLSVESEGKQLAVWDSFDGTNLSVQAAINTGSGWSAATSLQTLDVTDENAFLHSTAVGPGNFVLSWQNNEHQLHGITCLDGQFSAPYLISQADLAVTGSCLKNIQFLFTTSASAYCTTLNPNSPTPTPVSKVAFPRPVQISSVAIDTDLQTGKTIFVFQDLETKFLIAGIYDGQGFSYTTIEIRNMLIEHAKVVLNPVDGLAAVIWRFTDGEIQAARFDGHIWTSMGFLSSKGASPDIAINPTNNHIVAVWADLTAGGGSNAIKSSEFDRSNWSTPVSLSQNGAIVEKPQIAINSQGKAFVIWSRKEGTGSMGLIESANSL